ncbi:MAG: hypothetical protein K9K75_06840 [Deltaproteobacteria bacterium]|nr:hypothetical protein [Deltaproteobacteria bacterium]
MLQIPPDQYRCHFVRVNAMVHYYIDGTMAIFYGPSKLAHYDSDGKLAEKTTVKTKKTLEKNRIKRHTNVDSAFINKQDISIYS